MTTDMTTDISQLDDPPEIDSFPDEPPNPSPAQRLLTISKRNYKPLVLIAIGAIQLLMFFQVILLTVWVSKLARKPAPTLVELTNGNSLSVEATDPLARRPENIRKFVATTLTRLFSWSAVLPPGDDGKVTSDKGVVVSGAGLGGRRVPTPTYQQGFALSESFRATFLQQLGELVPRTVFMGGTRTVLMISRISDPVELEPGKWKVDVVATLVTFSQNDKVGQGIEFNKSVFVSAVYPPPELQLTSDNEIARTIAQVRSPGLEVYRITDLNLQ